MFHLKITAEIIFLCIENRIDTLASFSNHFSHSIVALDLKPFSTIPSTVPNHSAQLSYARLPACGYVLRMVL